MRHRIGKQAAGPLAALALLAASTSSWAEDSDAPAPALAFAPDQASLPAAPGTTAGAEQELGAGLASWYGDRFAGRRTASGERFDPDAFTAAHRTLPFGSLVRVTRLETGETVVVRINDRGPFTGKRVIDLSEAAARRIGLIGPGHGEVSLTLLGI